MAGIAVKPGASVWRPPGSRHSARSPEGRITLAMFQVPNNLYDQEGRATGLRGKPWDELWALPAPEDGPGSGLPASIKASGV